MFGVVKVMDRSILFHENGIKTFLILHLTSMAVCHNYICTCKNKGTGFNRFHYLDRGLSSKYIFLNDFIVLINVREQVKTDTKTTSR